MGIEKIFINIKEDYFQPQEADHLIIGLFYQAINGLGRTPARQLAQALDYRFSGKYEKDLELPKV